LLELTCGSCDAVYNNRNESLQTRVAKPHTAIRVISMVASRELVIVYSHFCVLPAFRHQLAIELLPVHLLCNLRCNCVARRKENWFIVGQGVSEPRPRRQGTICPRVWGRHGSKLHGFTSILHAKVAAHQPR